MKITHGNTKQELQYLSKLFVKLFENKVDDTLETTTYGKLSLYMYNYVDHDFLENFVKEYFKLRNKIIYTRNGLMDFMKSVEYKKADLIYKIKIKKEFAKWQKLCENINKFEKEFYNRINISLLAVENERFAKEKQSNNDFGITIGDLLGE